MNLSAIMSKDMDLAEVGLKCSDRSSSNYHKAHSVIHEVDRMIM